MQILPISSVEKHTVGDGRPGTMTKKLQKMFDEAIKAECRQKK
jgi:branched-subunit amino acid aminotransferase/4-amino-4-deoxychorismate lyase